MGPGKSTLLRMMAGLEQPSNGEVRLMPGYSVGILPQEPALDEGTTVLANVEGGVAGTKALIGRYSEVAAKMAADYSGELLEVMGRLQEQLDHREAWDLDSRVEQAMDALRCPPPDAEMSVLSGGERRRVALCRLLLSQPDLLLLDEPTNHLDAESVAWLEQHLGKYPGTVVAVTHDRYFLDNVADWILELDRGHAYPYEGNYSTYLETKAAWMKVEGQQDAKLRRRLEEELEWVRSSPRARQAKSRARLDRYEQMAAEAASRAKTVWEVISGGEAYIRAGRAEIPSRAYVAAFGFKGSDQQRLAGLLSGGERDRVNLALPLKQGGNLLHEPANDLDVETLASLEHALGEFPGCAVITSHDRWFLDRVATHILAWEGEATWFWFEGNFASYEKNKTGRLGAEAARPHRVTYRKLTR